MQAFISYRREGGADTARVIRAELSRRNIQTFLDVEDLGSQYFDERLLREIESAPNFILVLSPSCLDRCSSEGDWLRREIVHAIETGRNIVPILKDRFQFPSVESLPHDIAPLVRYNCVEYSHIYLDAAMNKLIKFLRVETTAASVPSPPGSAAGREGAEADRPSVTAESWLGASHHEATITQRHPNADLERRGLMLADQMKRGALAEARGNLAAMLRIDPTNAYALKIANSIHERLAAPDLVGEIIRLRGHAKLVRTVAYSPDGRHVLSGGLDHTIRLWDLEAGHVLRSFEGHKSMVTTAVFSPDGRHILSADGAGAVRFWDAENGGEIRRFEGHKYSVWSVAVSPDGCQALSGGWDSTVRLWDVAAGREVSRFDGHTEEVRSTAFMPDGKRALSSGQDRTVRLWDVASGAEIRRYDRHSASVTAVAFSPDGQRALSGSHDHSVRLWDVERGSELCRFEGHTALVMSVALSPVGAYALSGGLDGTLRLWDLSRGKEIHCFRGHVGNVYSVAFSPDGRHAVSGGADRTARLWALPVTTAS